MQLLERDAELARLAALWHQAAAGDGRLVFLGGEAGAGKTSVVHELARRMAGHVRFLVGACDAGTAPRPLGPVLDVADELGIQTELEDAQMSTASLMRLVRAALGRSPTVLLLEDLHWADGGTVDLLRFLGRRLPGLPLLVVVTFRDDEVPGTHPLASVMGELATAAGVSRMQLPLLTPAAVAELVSACDHDIDPAALYARTDGNPFFVTEVLAAGTAELPGTVRDAVTTRAGRLSLPARRALEVAAVIGTSAEIAVLQDVSGQPPAAVDECVARGLLRDRGTAVAFAHELSRQAILDALPPAERVDVHRRVLARLVAAGSADHRRLAQHAVACGDSAAVVRHAPPAAADAARLGSHREAAEQLRTALRHADALPGPDRAELLERLSYECHLTSQPADAFEFRRQAVALRSAAGDRRRLGVGQRWLSRLSWFLGRNADAERYAVAAVGTLEPLGVGADLAMAYSNVSLLRMLSGTTEEALAWGWQALDVARTVGDREVQAHALNNLGTALLRRGDLVAGRQRLDESLAIALADGLDEHAARAFTNMAVLQVIRRSFDEAAVTLRRGLAYCSEHDLDLSGLYMQGWLAGVLLEQGQAKAAVDLAEDVLRHRQPALTSRIPALLTIGLAAVRRGDSSKAEQLVEVHRLAVGTAEPLRLLPVALLQAEAAWTAGRTAEIVPMTDGIWAACADGWEPWILAELAWWRTLGGASPQVPFQLPEPFALMRDGRPREASEAWTAIGRPFWAALALAGGSPADASAAVAGLLRVDAPASAQAVRRDRALRGLPVPRGPRGTAQSNPAGLTARELDVLGHLVRGLSDAEIAASLTLSERTVGHHVSAVLRKLGVPSRSRAAAAATSFLTAAAPPAGHAASGQHG